MRGKEDGPSLREAFFRFVCQTSPEPLGIEVVRAQGSWVWDRSGRRYLDFLSGMGVAHVGHTHPAVVRAVQEQAERYLHAMVYGEYIQEPQVELARRLAQVVPSPLSVTYFTSSGTEAVEGALKTARKYTRRPRLVSFWGSFHGDTLGSLSVGGNPLYRDPFLPLLPEVLFLPFDEPEALSAVDTSVAGVIVEPVQGEGGVRIPHEGFLSALRKRCTEVGALLIFDEVITGLGRTGKLFACEHWGVAPDLLVLAKALGGGMPLGAFIGPPEVMSTLSQDPPLAHVTTFGGHPVCCAAGLACLKVILEEKLPERARTLGKSLLERLQEFTGRGKLKEVRGLGLLLGMEFGEVGATQRFVRSCFARGLILNWTLHSDKVVRLAPPLTLEPGEMDLALDIMDQALREG